MVLNLPVIPDGWAAHHRPVAKSTMTGICKLTGPAGGYDYDTGELAPGPTLAADVPCRVQELNREARAETAGQLVDTRQYLVTLPLDRVPALTITDQGPVLTVTGNQPGHDGDPHLTGRPLRVLSVQHGTLLWERDLTCVDDLTNQ